MKCPQCQAEIQVGNQFCFRCGGKIGNSAEGIPRVTIGPEMDRGFNPASLAVPVVMEGSPRRGTVLDDDAPASGAVPRMGAAAPVQQSSAPVRGRTVLDDAPKGTVASPAQGSDGRIVGWLVSFDFNASGQQHVLRAGRTTIGRGRDQSLSLFFDSKASELHASIVWRRGLCGIKDEGSSNGTFVNGDDLGIGGSHALRSGDIITIGSCRFLLFLIDPVIGERVWPDLTWEVKK